MRSGKVPRDSSYFPSPTKVKHCIQAKIQRAIIKKETTSKTKQMSARIFNSSTPQADQRRRQSIDRGILLSAWDTHVEERHGGSPCIDCSVPEALWSGLEEIGNHLDCGERESCPSENRRNHPREEATNMNLVASVHKLTYASLLAHRLRPSCGPCSEHKTPMSRSRKRRS